jgi:hypothetical protein
MGRGTRSGSFRGAFLVVTGASAAELDRMLSEKGRRLGDLPRIRNSEQVLAEAGAVHFKRAEEILERSVLGRRLSRPVQVLVKEPSDRRKNRVLRGHCWSSGLPEKSLVFVAPGLYACAPEFSYLQESRRLSIPLSSLFGMEIVGSFVRDGASEYGCRTAQPATDIEAVRNFVRKASGKPGARKARMALRFVLEGSRSPQESKCALLLSLPKRYGGFGLPKPLLNPRIETNPEYQQTGLSEPRYCDIYYPRGRLDIEYNGAQHEQGAAPIHDLERERALFRVGITVVSLTAAALANRFEMTRLARGIERKLGCRTQEDSSLTIEMRKLLFDAFFPPREQGCPWFSEAA